MNSREWCIVPMLNPDGSEWDIHGGRFHNWRKNRQPNGPGEPIGTDLNRNYSFQLGLLRRFIGQPGFTDLSRPGAVLRTETQAMRDFVNSRVIGGSSTSRSPDLPLDRRAGPLAVGTHLRQHGRGLSATSTVSS